jgi:hypothetical protein
MKLLASLLCFTILFNKISAQNVSKDLIGTWSCTEMGTDGVSLDYIWSFQPNGIGSCKVKINNSNFKTLYCNSIFLFKWSIENNKNVSINTENSVTTCKSTNGKVADFSQLETVYDELFSHQKFEYPLQYEGSKLATMNGWRLKPIKGNDQQKSAQEPKAKKEERTLIVLKGSFNVANVKVENSTLNYRSKSRIGYGLSLGLYQMLDKNEKFYLSAHAGLNSRGNDKVRALYADVPVAIGVAVGRSKSILISGGVYGGMALMGSYKFLLQDRTKIKFGEQASDNRSRTDYGYVISLANFANDFGVVMGIDFYGGLKNVVPESRQATDGSLKLRSTVISVSVPLSAF